MPFKIPSKPSKNEISDPNLISKLQKDIDIGMREKNESSLVEFLQNEIIRANEALLKDKI